MNNAVGKYTFREVDRELQIQTRTHNDLKNQEHFERAASTAQDLTSQVQDTYLDVLSLDQSEYDLNSRPGEVLLKDYDYQGGRISGHAYSLQEHPGRARVVMEMGVQEAGKNTSLKYTIDPDQNYLLAQRVSNSGTPSEVRESVARGSYVRDGITSYTVVAGPEAEAGSLSLARPPYSPDKAPSWPRETVQEAQVAFRDDKLDFQPRTLGDLNGIEERRALIDQGNQTRDLVRSIYEGVLALDGTPADLNPLEGEVLFKNAEIEGRSLSGFLSKLQVQDGDTRETDLGGTFPYMVAHSEQGDEKFTAILPNREAFRKEISYPHAPGMKGGSYIHDDGEREVQVDLGHGAGNGGGHAHVSIRETPKMKEEAPKSWWQGLLGR